MKTVLILINYDVGLYNTRLELIENLLLNGYNVVISCPQGEKIDELIQLGCKHYDIKMDRHGINPYQEMKLLKSYYELIKNVQPNVVLGYTIKPNIYGAMASKRYKVPFIANITGMGMLLHNDSIFQKIATIFYKIALSNVHIVFFQNTENLKFFIDKELINGKYGLLPGSGVNLKQYQIQDYPETHDIHFVFISRIMKDKGIEEYLEAAEYIKEKYPYTKFHICGFLDGDYEGVLNEHVNRGTVEYHGMVKDVQRVLSKTHCTIHPSYHEGMSNVLLESAASGRPVLASDIPGCRETFDEGISGFGFKSKNTQSLIEAIEKFLQLTNEEKKQMGLAGRLKVEQEFDRKIVVQEYLNEIRIALEEK